MAPADPSSRWVRLYDILGQSTVPPDAAKVIAKAVEKAVEVGDVSARARWQIVEFWAADYLAGAETDHQKRVRRAVDSANRKIKRERAK
jgi:hypothetical protein